MLDIEFKKSLLDVIQEFHNFCEENNLKYYLIGGGLIGAVRHQGFIPWDNDIDVAMPRSDYEKLLSLKNNFNERIGIKVPYIDKDYYNTKTRVYSLNFKVQEDFYRKYTIGPWIDIFPLDYTFDNKFLRVCHFRIIYLIKILYASRLGGVNVHGSFKAKFKLLLYFILKPIPVFFIDYLFTSLITIKSQPGVYCGNLMGRWKEKEIIEIYELDNRKLYDFCGLKIYSFYDCDKWLSNVYGDYMKLPDIKNRVPDHPIKYID